MNKIDTNDNNRTLTKKFGVIFLILLISGACQAKPPTKLTTTPINQYATSSNENKNKNPYDQVIFIGNKKLNVQIVTSDSDMQKGLSGRNKLNDNEGMLFDFKKLSRPNFWMKDMNFDLDLIWIANKKVVGITNNVPAPVNSQSLIVNGSLPTYPAPAEVDMVLEVNAGWSKANGIKIGDEIE